MKSLILVVSLFFFPPQQDLFDQATEAYNAEEYTKSIELYEKVLAQGKHSAAVYFNLGNAHYQLREVGLSVYYFEKALMLDPDDPEIQNNLNYAKNMRIDAIDEVPKSFLRRLSDTLLGWFHFDQWARIAIAFILLSVLAFLAYQWITGSALKRFFFIFSLGAFGLCVIALLLGFFGYQKYKAEQPAIILSEQVNFSSAPNSRGDILFTLHEGTKVNIQEEYDEWAKVSLADGQTGWILSESIRPLKDF